MQFDFSGKPEGWVCSDHALGAMRRLFGPGLAAKPKSRSESLMMDVSSFARLHAGGRELLIYKQFLRSPRYDLGSPPVSFWGFVRFCIFSYLIEAQRRAQYRGGSAFVR